MSQRRRHRGWHRLSVLTIAVLSVLIVVVYLAARPLPTSFYVEGDTTAATFTTLEQTESQDQAGLFANSILPVDLLIQCQKLERVASSQSMLNCDSGFTKATHVFVETVRLPERTKVELLVADGNLEVTLSPAAGERALVTLMFDAHTNVTAAERGSRKIEGEWTVDSGDFPIHLIFLHPRFSQGNNEGGQRLSPKTSVAFQHQNHSAFLDNTAMLSVVGIESEARKPINGDLFQAYSVSSGQVKALWPIEASGTLRALHVEVQAVSRDIRTVDSASELPVNHATDTLERLTGIRVTRGWAVTTLCVPLVLAVLGALFAVHYARRIERHRHRPGEK